MVHIVLFSFRKALVSTGGCRTPVSLECFVKHILPCLPPTLPQELIKDEGSTFPISVAQGPTSLCSTRSSSVNTCPAELDGDHKHKLFSLAKDDTPCVWPFPNMAPMADIIS